MKNNPTVPPNGGKGQLADVDLSGLNLKTSSFNNANLERASFRQADLASSSFIGATLNGADFAGAKLDEARLERAVLEGASLRNGFSARGSQWREAQLRKAMACEADFERADLTSAVLHDADFRGANLSNTVLTGVNLLGADLRGANLYGAQLTNTAWRGTRIDENTNLRATVWRPEHDSPNDGAEELQLSRVRSVLNWATIRVVGHLPVFAGSYLLLTFSLAVATTIGWLNASPILQNVRYPIPFPPRLIALLLGSMLLAIGATLYELRCPPRVKEFSLTRWIEELHRPGVLYVSDTLQSRYSAAFAFFFLVAGGLQVGWVFVDRLASALSLVIGAIL